MRNRVRPTWWVMMLRIPRATLKAGREIRRDQGNRHCSKGNHRGSNWKYNDKHSCIQTGVCQRCGSECTRQRHDGGGGTCSRCGEWPRFYKRVDFVNIRPGGLGPTISPNPNSTTAFDRRHFTPSPQQGFAPKVLFPSHYWNNRLFCSKSLFKAPTLSQ